jgi:hypothetical protein
MTAVQTRIEHPTFETVWAALQEVAASQKETDRQMKENAERQAETDRLFKETREQMKENAERQAERQRETERQMKENAERLAERQAETDRQMKETDRQMKETDRKFAALSEQMGGLHNRFGEMAEHLVAPGIAERFNERGFHFDKLVTRGMVIKDEQGKVKAEIDVVLENGGYIIGVEVKATVKPSDVEHHIRRLEILREDREKKQEKPKKIQGAIAGAIFGSEEKEAVLEAGFYALEQSGDTMKMDIPDGFVPREW